MEVLQLIISWPGFAILALITLLILVVVFLNFPDRFAGINVGWKDAKLEIPKAQRPTPPSEALEVAEDPTPKPASPTTKVPPYIAVMEGALARDRQAVEVAIEALKKDRPHWMAESEVDAFGYFQLLSAGFTDALDDLKAEERDRPSDVFASTMLARYFTGLKAYDKAEHHLSVAESRAKTDDQKTRTWRARAALMEIASSRQAADFLVTNSQNIEDGGDKAILLEEAGRLYADSGDSGRAILAYEDVLRHTPQSVDARFRLALLYGARKATILLALRHYEVVLRSRPDYTGAMNNLGILYGELNVNPRKITLMKQAASTNGHSLGNLALYYVEAGLLDEAQTLLDSAESQALDNERALAAKQEVKRQKEKADKEQEKLMAQAEALAANINSFKFATPRTAAHYGKWEALDKSATLSVEITGIATKYVLAKGTVITQAYAWDVSPIAILTFSKDDQSTRSIISIGPTDGQDMLALFGEGRIRLVQINDGSSLEQILDFERGNPS
jgi:tetratricopeptide (TPR) repeat protein